MSKPEYRIVESYDIRKGSTVWRLERKQKYTFFTHWVELGQTVDRDIADMWHETYDITYVTLP